MSEKEVEYTVKIRYIGEDEDYIYATNPDEAMEKVRADYSSYWDDREILDLEVEET